MPPVSENQRKAMWAAASGKSTIGIPKKVGKEFAKADPGGKLPKKKAVDRSAHFKGNPGFPSSSEATSPPPDTYQTHENREREVMGAGYAIHEAAERRTGTSLGLAAHHSQASCGCKPDTFSGTHKAGALRVSGKAGAHQIGKRK